MIRRVLLTSILALLALTSRWGQTQTLVDNYRFSTGMDAYEWIDITGYDSVLLATQASTITSGRSICNEIGFSFPFADTSYTQFGVNSQGLVILGGRAMLPSWWTNPLTRPALMPMVNPFGNQCRLDTTCYIKRALIGTAGDRVLVVESRLKLNTTNIVTISAQVQLYEATGEVRIVYGPSDGTANATASQPGLARTTSDILFLDHATHSVQRLTSTPVPTNASGVWPEEGRWYSFVPEMNACPYPPVPSVVSNGFDTIVLNWNGIPGSSDWHLSIPLAGIDTLVSDTVLYLVGLNPLTEYLGYLQTVCWGDTSLGRRPFTFSTGCGTVHLLPWSDGFQVSASDECWQKANLTYNYRWQRQSEDGNYYMRTGYGSSSSTVYNEWLISPPVELPSTEGILLSWLYRSEPLVNILPKMRVLLLVCDTPDAVDTTDAWVPLDTIDDYEQDFQTHTLRLDDYAGQMVRVAFQRFGQGGKYAYVDDVTFKIETAPGVELAAPTNVNVGDTATVVAQLTMGLLSSPQYTWSSTMLAQGQATMLQSDDTLKLVYLAAGIDTVTMTLATDYGSTTATATISVCGTATTLPWYEDFEHSIDCWLQPDPYSNWALSDVNNHGGSGSLRSCYYNTTYRDNLIASQPIAIPADAYMLRLGWWMKRQSSPSGTIYVSVVDANASDLSSGTVLYSGMATHLTQNYEYFEVPLDTFAGQTVRVVFRHVNSNGNPNFIRIDDISIKYTRVPAGTLVTSPAIAYEGDTLAATVILSAGDTTGIAYQWSSSMADKGLANLLGNGPQVGIAYSSAGYDTVVVTVSNAYGSFSDTAVVRVCPVQDTLPWVADFGNDFPCWQVVSGECSVSGSYLSFTALRTMVVSPPVYIPTAGNVILEYDNAYSFFYGSTLVMVTTDMVNYDTIEDHPFTSGTHPSTRLSLNAYAGQHIRVAFKATGDILQYYLTQVNIRYALEPVVTVTADDGYFPGTPVTLTASLLEGDTTGLTYSWSSAMAQRGEATLTSNGGPQATLIPEVGGLDTVIVWATNAYGTDSAWIVVNIRSCDTVDALTWTEDFSNYLDCWWQPEGSLWSYPESGDRTMALAINVWMYSDSWLISRAIKLPSLPVAGNDELLLCWDASSQLNDTHSYCIMVTTAADYRDLNSYDTLIALDTTHTDITLGWNTMRVPITAYAGQTIHLAFRYTTETWEPNGQFPGVLIIDNIRFIDTTYPAPPPDTVWWTVSVTASVDGACEPYGSGVYADSSMVDIGYHVADTTVEGGHWEFLGWSDGPTATPRTILVTSDTVLVAQFEWVADSVGIPGNADATSTIELYPNPASTTVTIVLNEELRMKDEALPEILDLQGRRVIAQTTQYSDNQTIVIDISGLPRGVYFVRFDGSGAVGKLIVR